MRKRKGKKSKKRKKKKWSKKKKTVKNSEKKEKTVKNSKKKNCLTFKMPKVKKDKRFRVNGKFTKVENVQNEEQIELKKYVVEDEQFVEEIIFRPLETIWDINVDAFQMLETMRTVPKAGYRGDSRTTNWRKRIEENKKKEEAKTIEPITNFFSKKMTPSEALVDSITLPSIVETPIIQKIKFNEEILKEATKKLEEICMVQRNSKKNNYTVENFEYLRHLGVLRYFQLLLDGGKKVESSESVARMIFDKGDYVATCLRNWGKSFLLNGEIPGYNQGKFSKTVSFLEDEDIKEMCLSYLRSAKGKIRVEEFILHLQNVIFPDVYGFGLTISERTAHNWLKKLGFEYGPHKTTSYVDGHERDDVVDYRKNYLKMMKNYEKLMDIYDGENMDLIVHPQLDPGQKQVVLVVHDESIFKAHDDHNSYWFENGHYVLKKKGEGKSIMVSTFLCECHGILKDSIDDATVIFHPGANDQGYWCNSDLVKNLQEKALPIFNRLHPGCQALFSFDNSQNHSAVAVDGLVADRLNLSDGGKNVPMLRATSFEGIPQLMQTGDGVQKGIKTILSERGLWRDGLKLTCREQCSSNCCARTILKSQEDFQNQRSWLREVVEDAGHLFILFPKFHCELNYIEMFWACCKRYCRNNCDYTWKGLQETVPKSLASVSLVSIRKFARRCYRYMHAYELGLSGMEAERAVKQYKSHRKIPYSEVERALSN